MTLSVHGSKLGQNSIFSQNTQLKIEWTFYIRTTDAVHRKCHSIFCLKLKWKRTFLRVSISIQNWKLKKGISFSISNFQFLFENWKIKSSFFVFQFSFYFRKLNCQNLALIKLTLIWVNPLTQLTGFYIMATLVFNELM